MIDPAIKIEDCKHMEFGNPSSHTYGATFCWITFVVLTLRHFIFANRFNKLPFLKLLAWLSLNTTLLIIMLIGFSRVYKGVHSYN